MKIASWNVNSAKAHLSSILDWIHTAAPDVLCLQEIKSVTEAFPADAFAELGYNAAVLGQKTYNGVAILSKHPLEEVRKGLPGMEEDPQARYIEALVDGPKGVVRLASIYAPNGNPVDTEKFPYKLDWMAKLKAHAAHLMHFEEPLVLTGDYNIIPEEKDCFDPAVWRQDALFRPESRAALRRMLNLGFTDAFRVKNQAAGQYSFWDYQAGAWRKNNGIRIDLMLLSPQALDKLGTVGIDRDVRGAERPSDHVPVWCTLNE